MTSRLSAAIVIPSHNRAEAIGETLASLCQQEGGLGAVEAVYLADDCSTDDTVRVATDSWRGTLPLHVIQPPSNAGTYGNTNHVIAEVGARHDWLLFLHDDDLARPNWLAMMTERMASCEASVATVCSSWDLLYPDGTVAVGEDDPWRPVELIRAEPAAVRSTLMRGCWWHFSGAAMRVKALSAVGPFDASLPQCADWDWLMRCLDKGWAVEYVPRTLIGYRQHTATVSVRSFQTHRDISENLILARRYRTFLTPSDTARFYTRLVLQLARRAARAASRGEVAGILRAAQMAGRVAVNPFRFA